MTGEQSPDPQLDQLDKICGVTLGIELVTVHTTSMNHVSLTTRLSVTPKLEGKYMKRRGRDVFTSNTYILTV